jgi:hypothetical protein
MSVMAVMAVIIQQEVVYILVEEEEAVGELRVLLVKVEEKHGRVLLLTVAALAILER